MTGKTAEKNTGKTMQSKPDMNPDVKPGAKPPMQKAAPGTTKRIFDYIFQYKWHVIAIVVCILVGAAAQAGSALFLQSLIDSYILPMVGATDPDWGPLLRARLARSAAGCGSGSSSPSNKAR